MSARLAAVVWPGFLGIHGSVEAWSVCAVLVATYVVWLVKREARRDAVHTAS